MGLYNVYTTSNYSSNHKCNDNVICITTDDNIVFGAITKFEVDDNNDVIAVIKTFNTKMLHDNFYSYTTNNNDLLKVFLNGNVLKCQIFSINQIKYLSILHYYLLIDKKYVFLCLFFNK